MKNGSRIGLAVSAVCAVGFSGQAQAQQTVALEEIVVTARKTEETLQSAPVAVSAFTAERIEDRQIQSVDDVARFTPGLVFDRNFGRATERPVIRGQSNILAGVTSGAEAGASYFVDGVYFAGDIQDLDLGDVERVEVIRGPQSALYGRNTYSGAINFVTRAPSDTLEANARISYDRDESSIGLRLAGPIAEGLTGSVALRQTEFDGQWKNLLTSNTVGQEKTQAANVVLEWRPSEDFRLRLRGGYTDDDDGTRALFLQDSSFNNCEPGTRSLASYVNATNGIPNNPNQYFCGAIRPQPIALNDGPVTNLVTTPAVPPTVLLPYPWNRPPGSPPGGPTSAYLPDTGLPFSGVARTRTTGSLLADWDLAGSGYTLTVAAALRDEKRRTGADSTFTAVNFWAPFSYGTGATAFLNSADAIKYSDYSTEIRLASPTDRTVRWLLGAFYYDLDQKTRPANFLYPRGIPIVTEISKIKNTAVFGLVEWHITDTLGVTAEGRYAEDKKSLAQFSSSTGASTYADAAKFKKFTPRVTVSWEPTSDLNLYAIYAEGNKPGGLNGTNGLLTNPPALTWEEETSKNYELGVKATWLDGRLQTNVAAFFIDASKVQLTTSVAPANPTSSSVSVVTNQGSAEIRGIEVEAHLRPVDPLTLSLTYALADSEFTKGCDDFQWTLTSGGGVYNPSNPTANNLNGQGDCSIKGHQLPMSAKNTASFAVDWRNAFRDGLEWFANADVTYTDKRYVQVHNLAYVPEATVVGARLGVAGERWTAALYGRNLTNEDAPLVATRWFTLPLGFAYGNQIPAADRVPGADYGSPRGFFAALRRERQVGIEFTYKYGQ
jgi:outer membrane receptor protein involved in Fe transport